MNVYERNVRGQMDDLGDECIAMKAYPMLLICIDEQKKGHMFWPDELPSELIAALPALLDDVRDSLAWKPL